MKANTNSLNIGFTTLKSIKCNKSKTYYIVSKVYKHKISHYFNTYSMIQGESINVKIYTILHKNNQ